jgi:4-amino-4-deoxy-L-arabinose transferase-like glycosyltransferase
MLRAHNADAFPIDNNDDGLFYVWAGTSFIEHPLQVRSHSIFDEGNEKLLWRSQYHDYYPHLRFGMKIVQPWFDHPPFGPLLIGWPAYLLGFVQVEQIPQLIVRYPALIASIWTLFFTYLLAKKLFSKRIAFFALVFMAIVPYFVFAHRQSYLENFITPLFLGAAVSFLYYTETKLKRYIWVAAILVFLCGWIKIPAFAVPFMFVGWSLYIKDSFSTKLFFWTGVISFVSYLGYGFLADSHFFLDTLLNQSGRGMYLSSFVSSMTNPQFYGTFLDGQYTLSLILSFFMVVQSKKDKSLQFYSWFFMSWLLVLFLVSGELNNSPWYRYPLIPFMAIALGHVAEELWQSRNLFLAGVFILFTLSGFDLAGISFTSDMLRIGVLMLYLPFVAEYLFPKKYVSKFVAKVAVIGLFGTIIVANLLAIHRYPDLKCQQGDCLLPTKIQLSRD